MEVPIPLICIFMLHFSTKLTTWFKSWCHGYISPHIPVWLQQDSWQEEVLYFSAFIQIACKSSDSEVGVTWMTCHTMPVILLAQTSLQACQSTHLNVNTMSILNLAIFHHCSTPHPEGKYTISFGNICKWAVETQINKKMFSSDCCLNHLPIEHIFHIFHIFPRNYVMFSF